MRDVKFRLIDTKSTERIDPKEFFIADSEVFIYYSDFDNSEKADMRHHVILHCTGLKDKNGMDIYEGDIVQTGWQGREKGVVVFESSTYCVDSGEGYMYFNHPESYEVIGNIYENKELLERDRDER